MEVKRCGEKEFLSADKLRIRENEIHIWCICWPEMTDFWKNHEYILSEQESEQAGKFRFPEDRMRYIAGKLIVRILLKRYLDVETVDFSVNELGKPYHKEIAGKQTVNFNISHSGEFIGIRCRNGYRSGCAGNGRMPGLQGDSREFLYGRRSGRCNK